MPDLRWHVPLPARWSPVAARAQTTWGYVPTNAFPSLVFSNPVCITSPPGETNRLFVVEKHGRIVAITNLAIPTRTIFMDLSSRVSVVNASESADLNNEEGMLSMTFDPGYATNRYFYVFYMGPATNGTSGLHDILSRFQITSANANSATPIPRPGSLCNTTAPAITTAVTRISGRTVIFMFRWAMRAMNTTPLATPSTLIRIFSPAFCGLT